MVPVGLDAQGMVPTADAVALLAALHDAVGVVEPFDMHPVVPLPDYPPDGDIDRDRVALRDGTIGQAIVGRETAHRLLKLREIERTREDRIRVPFIGRDDLDPPSHGSLLRVNGGAITHLSDGVMRADLDPAAGPRQVEGMTRELSDLTHALIDAACKAGADAADAVALQDDTLSIEVLDGALEHADRSEGTEIGLRVFVGRRQASVSASDTRPDMIATLAERAVAMARIAPEDPFAGLAEPEQLARDADAGALDLLDETEPDPQALEERALAAEQAARDVQGVSQVQAAGAGWSHRAMHLAATNGFSGGYGRTGWSISAVAISGEGLGMERDYFGDSRSHAADLMTAAEIGRIAGERAAARAGSSRPPTGRFPVLYDERISSGLIGHLVAAANGAMIARGSSWLKDALGAQVLPEGFDLVEDPHRRRVGGSRPFDGEGLPTARRVLVENGILTGWTLDLATARQLGMTSTASAARGVGGSPSPSVGNLALTQGASSKADLIADMGTGLLVTSLIGSTINPTTGDYSRGASGFWIENGEIVRPVNECTIAGNLRDMLMTIRAANDARPHLSRVVPSLLVEGLTIAGA